MKPWIRSTKELVAATALFKIFKVGYRSEQSGREGKFDVIESKDWINVVPFTKDGRVLLVEQFRFGIGEVTLEFPAGNIEAGQTPLEAAIRELNEETGGAAEAVKAVGRTYGNPAFLNNHCHHFTAHGVELKGSQSLDEHEEIKLRAVALEEIEGMIKSGKIRHAHSIASWHFARAMS